MRRLIFEGKYEEAQNMAATKILSQVGNEMPYQTVGRLNIRYQDHKKVNNYYRDLDISNAVAVTRYEVDGVEFTEETFASLPINWLSGISKHLNREQSIANCFLIPR